MKGHEFAALAVGVVWLETRAPRVWRKDLLTATASVRAAT